MSVDEAETYLNEIKDWVETLCNLGSIDREECSYFSDRLDDVAQYVSETDGLRRRFPPRGED